MNLSECVGNCISHNDIPPISHFSPICTYSIQTRSNPINKGVKCPSFESDLCQASTVKKMIEMTKLDYKGKVKKK